jgi:SPP1 family predicted phage head-tail adaptor
MAKRADIGKLRERVTIQTYTTTANAYGEQVITYSTYGERWASVEYRQNLTEEDQLSERKTALTEAWFTLRYDDQVNTKMQLVYRTLTYDITGITHTADRMYTVLQSTQRDA